MKIKKIKRRGRTYLPLPTDFCDSLFAGAFNINDEKANELVREIVRFSYKEEFYHHLLLTPKVFNYIKNEYEKVI